jgi:signal transduction histidine kinase
LPPAARDPRRWGARLTPRTVWVLVALTAALSVVSAVLVARHLAADARHASAVYARVFAGLADPRESGATDALLALAREIRSQGIPLVVTDVRGGVSDTANLPRAMAYDSPELQRFIAALDQDNPPVDQPGVGMVHIGTPPMAAYFRTILILELLALAGVGASGYLAYRFALRGERARVFAAMARESAHQLGTPLSSLAGWIEQLRTREDPEARRIGGHLADDYARLERVARRFERIGQPPRRDLVDVADLAHGVADYFRPRLPTLAHPVTVEVRSTSAAPVVRGDALLLEWALEALVKNAVDALTGRGGRVLLSVADEPDDVVLRVADDGPGVPREMRHRLFEPGATTKAGGWGMGLVLARRIVEETHGGRLALERSDAGASFAARLPREEAVA